MSASTASFTVNRAASMRRRAFSSGDCNLERMNRRIKPPLDVHISINENTSKIAGGSSNNNKTVKLGHLVAAETPLFQAVFTIIAFILLVLVVVAGLVEIDRWNSTPILDFSDLEAFVKENTTTTVQPGLEADYDKLDIVYIEYGILMLNRAMKSIDQYIDFIKKPQSRLKSNYLLNVPHLSYGDLSLEEIKALFTDISDNENRKLTRRFHYALLAGDGAIVVNHSEPFVVDHDQCFPLKGNNGFVQIKLNKAMNPKAITLEHVNKSVVAYERSSAPRDCRVYGWLQGWEDLDLEFENRNMLLTEFSYDVNKSNAQTFDVFNTARYQIVDVIRFEFTSNHGDPTQTCIYRITLHGDKPSPVSCYIQLNKPHAPIPLDCIHYNSTL